MPREPVYTPSQAYTAESIFGSQFGSQELTRLDYAFEEDDEHVSTVEGNQEAKDGDFVCSQGSSSDYSGSSQDSTWSCSQPSSQGSAANTLRPIAEDDTATMIDEGQDWDEEPASQKTIPDRDLVVIADGKLDGRRLCRIAQVYKEWHARDSGFGGIPPEWRRVVRILYGLDEAEENAAYGFVKEHHKSICPLYESTPAQWSLAHGLAQEEWEDRIRKARGT
ncbi:hypothetical protein C8Q70DRAFT_1057830 [Cubamyces menziesii]|nr:hypothetical protein C8Q70DRAFT_1057830 [Cubamyces menziesii]